MSVALVPLPRDDYYVVRTLEIPPHVFDARDHLARLLLRGRFVRGYWTINALFPPPVLEDPPTIYGTITSATRNLNPHEAACLAKQWLDESAATVRLLRLDFADLSAMYPAPDNQTCMSALTSFRRM
jgi:hypothetical protein